MISFHTLFLLVLVVLLVVLVVRVSEISTRIVTLERVAETRTAQIDVMHQHMDEMCTHRDLRVILGAQTQKNK